MNFAKYRPLYAPEGGGSDPAPEPKPSPTPTPPASGYSPEYVRDLREETKGWRLKAAEQETLRKAAEAAVANAAKEAEDKLKAADEQVKTERAASQKAADDRVIRAELRTAAVKAGMVDLDGLKLADLSTVKLNADGDVDGADELMTKLKESKPYLFGEPSQGTSNPAPKPAPKTPSGKPALEMTAAEYAQKLKDINAGKPI